MGEQTENGSSVFGNKTKIGFMISGKGFAMVAFAKILGLAAVFSTLSSGQHSFCSLSLADDVNAHV